MRVQFFFLLAPALLSGQSFSVGAKVGVPTSGPASESRPYSVGPVVELQFRGGFAIEAGALYRRLGSTYWYKYSPNADTSSVLVNRARGNSWEFPLLGKYYFRQRARIQPFVGAGLSMRTIGWAYEGSTTSILSGQSLQPIQVTPFQVNNRSSLNVGPTFAAGFRTRIGRVQWQPEIRFTQWGRQDSGPTQPKGEAGVYLGFRF